MIKIQNSKLDKKANFLVMKFGGSSVGSTDALVRSINIIKDQRDKWDGLIIVVSAMSGITNLLISCVLEASNFSLVNCN